MISRCPSIAREKTFFVSVAIQLITDQQSETTRLLPWVERGSIPGVMNAKFRGEVSRIQAECTNNPALASH